jgi:hypothetical protein
MFFPPPGFSPLRSFWQKPSESDAPACCAGGRQLADLRTVKLTAWGEDLLGLDLIAA